MSLHWRALAHDEIVAQWKHAMGELYPFGPSRPEAVTPERIANTAIPADLTLQAPATVPVTHYFDLRRRCRDCDRPFVFFAAEQKHWHEELGFGLDSDCVHCTDCRKRRQGVARSREAYEALFHTVDRTIEQTLEMADAGLSLIEAGTFSKKLTQQIRALLNAVPADINANQQAHHARLVERVRAIEA